MRKHKTLKAFGAAALAAATVASGLSFGTSAASAASPSANESLQLILKGTDGKYYSYMTWDGRTTYKQWNTLAAAESESPYLSVRLNSNGSFGLSSDAGCINFNAWSTAPGNYYLNASHANSCAQFTARGDGSVYVSGRHHAGVLGGVVMTGIGTSAKGWTAAGDWSVVSPAKNGGFEANGVGTATTIMAGETRDVTIGIKTTTAISRMSGTKVTMTAPAGTTFPSSTTKINGQVKHGSADWTPHASFTLTGSVSADGRTFTATMPDSQPGFTLTSTSQIAWSTPLSAAADADPGTRNLAFTANGTSNAGAFSIAGNSPVTIHRVVENGGFKTTGHGYSYSMAAGTERTMKTGAMATTPLSTLEGTVTLTAPAGTTFTPGQTVLSGQHGDGGPWVDDPKLRLVGSVSSDGSTFTGTVAKASLDSPNVWAIAWTVSVTAAPRTTDITGHLGMSGTGSTNHGNFAIADRTTLTIKGVEAVAPTARVVTQNDDDRTALIAGTGQPGAQIVGPLGAETLVSENGTWNMQVTALEVGKNTVEFTQMIDGRPSGKVSVDVTIKDNAPKPTTAKVDSVDDAARTAKVSGTATKGSEIRVGDTVIATADSDGNWSGTVSGLEVGTQDVTFAQYINGTKVNDTTIPITVKKAEVAPLEVITPKNGATVDSNRPVFSGTGDVGATIEVRGSSRVVATATVDSDGKWSVPAGFDLADGTYNLTVKQTATSGDASTKTVTFTIKDTAGHVDLTAKGAFDADVSKPATISGAATAGATVIVRDTFGNEIARTIATSNKTYSVAIPAGKAQFGVNEFSVTQTVKGQVSAPEKVSLDYGTPTPVDITSPENGATVDKKDLTFTGTGQSGAKVDIRGMVNAIASGTVADGKWTAKVNYTLSNNVYNLWAVQTTKGGMTTRQAITVTVTDQAVAPLTATAAFNTTDANLPATVVGTAQNGATVTVKSSTGTVIGTATVVAGKYTVAVDPKHADFGINTFTITQTVNGKESAPLNRTLDYGNPVAPAITTPANGATVTAGKVTFTGTGDTGSTLDMRGMVSAVGTGKVVNGSWTVETRELSANVYKLFAVQTSKGGLTKQVETTITLQDKKVTELTAVGTFDAENDKDATISGNAENGATVVVKEGSTVIKTVTAVNGKYSVAIPAVGSGVRTFAVTQTVDGTVSPAKSASLDYGTVTPVAVTSPSNGDKVKAGTITFTGTGTPGALVKVGGTVSQLGSAKVNAQGDWSLTLDRQLSPQVYTLFVKQTTKGNLVGDAVERTFTVVK